LAGGGGGNAENLVNGLEMNIKGKRKIKHFMPINLIEWKGPECPSGQCPAIGGAPRG
jgi:hypothetical protein